MRKQMSPHRISAIAKEILGPVADEATGWAPTVGKRAMIGACERAIQAALYEERCQMGLPPHDINNPPFVRHCAPNHDQQ